jgi:D-glycero-alpha-D-manno-heptose 1-phosphate guanylyltransferase
VKNSDNTPLCTENIGNRTPEHLTAVTLSGCLGMRLWAVVQNRPKVRANVAGRPFLTYVVDRIIGAYIKHAVVCAGCFADSIAGVLNANCQRLQLLYSYETTLLGTEGRYSTIVLECI